MVSGNFSEFHSRNNLIGEIVADEILINLFDTNKIKFLTKLNYGNIQQQKINFWNDRSL